MIRKRQTMTALTLRKPARFQDLGEYTLDTLTGELIPKVLEHEFWVRRGVKVRVKLPADLSKSEAERLAKFVEILPFPKEKKTITISVKVE